MRLVITSNHTNNDDTTQTTMDNNHRKQIDLPKTGELYYIELQIMGCERYLQ